MKVKVRGYEGYLVSVNTIAYTLRSDFYYNVEILAKDKSTKITFEHVGDEDIHRLDYFSDEEAQNDGQT